MILKKFIEEHGRAANFQNIRDTIKAINNKEIISVVIPYMEPPGRKELNFLLLPMADDDARLINFAYTHRAEDMAGCNKRILEKLGTIIDVKVYEVNRTR